MLTKSIIGHLNKEGFEKVYGNMHFFQVGDVKVATTHRSSAFKALQDLKSGDDVFIEYFSERIVGKHNACFLKKLIVL